MEAAARPLPRDERTPPVIKMNFVFMFIKSCSDKELYCYHSYLSNASTSIT
jgi:hypothetical protein